MALEIVAADLLYVQNAVHMLTEIVANVTCDASMLKACLTRDTGPSVTSSQLNPPCAEAVKQTNNDGFCYVIDMAVCKSVDTQVVS